MKLEQFEQVLEVAKTGTFSQAARNLYMSQPNRVFRSNSWKRNWDAPSSYEQVKV